MPNYPTCLFCGRNDSPPDKEELVAKWIAREFSSPEWDITMYHSSGGRKFKARNHFGVTTRKACRRCNNEWMSNLESQAIPILKPLLHGKQSTLSQSDQLILAKWAMKFAVVYDIHDEREEYFFSNDDCHALFKSGAMPLYHSAIYLADYKVSGPEHIRLTETRRSGAPLLEADQHLPELETYAATFAIKHLALQVVTIRRCEEVARPVNFLLPPQWQDVNVCIWPFTGSATWPPRYALDQVRLDMFASRWKSPNIMM